MKALREERNEALAKSGTGTALVVVTDKLALRDQEFGAPKYGKPKQVNITSREGAMRGRAAADRVGFNKVIDGNNKTMVTA